MIINDTTALDVLFPPSMGRGAILPDYTLHPEATPLMKVSPNDIKTIPRSEWSDRIADKARFKSRLSDIRASSGPGGQRIPSLNQGEIGYCWGHSATMAHMLLRAAYGLPYVKLSAFMVCSIIKGGRDEGGWGALAADFIEKNGQCTDASWPEGSRDLRLDTPAVRQEAEKYKIVTSWADITFPVWNRTLEEEVAATLLLSNVPIIADFAWWGHSVVLMDLVEIERGSFGYVGLNSWGDTWGDLGQFTLQGSKTKFQGAVAPRSVSVMFL